MILSNHMYHRNIIPIFVVFSIAVLLAIVVGSFLFQPPADDFQISASPEPIIPTTPAIPRSADPLITPGPSGT